MKKNIKIDVSIPLIFLMVLVSFILMSINTKFLITLKQNMFNYFCFIYIFVLSLIIVFIIKIFDKIIKNNKKININAFNNIAIFLIGILIIIFS